MKAQDLKNSILQLAIQGKLVAQDENDEPAEVLYAKIQAEKQKLIKEGKIKKDKPLPPITEDEIPFPIPPSWKWVRLGECLDIARGGSPRPIKSFLTTENTGLNWIKISDADKNGKYINSTQEKIIKAGLSKTRFVHKGDFLLTNSMSFGRPYILNIDGCIHDGWLVLSDIYKIFDVNFLYYLLSSRFSYMQFCHKVSGAVVQNLNSDKVANSIVPLPPLEEQKRIVAKIEELEPLINQYGQAEQELSTLNDKFPEQLKKSILQYAIQGKLVAQDDNDEPAEVLYAKIQAEKQKLIKEGKIKKDKPLPPITEDEIPFPIPPTWKWVRLGEIVEYGTTPSVLYKEIKQDNMWLLDLEDIEKNTSKVIHKKYTKDNFFKSTKKLFEKNDVLYSKLRPYLNKVLVADEKGVCTSEILPLRIHYGITPYFLVLVLKSPYFYDYVNKLTYGVKMPRLGTMDGKKGLIPLPPLEEQHRIVARVATLLEACALKFYIIN